MSSDIPCPKCGATRRIPRVRIIDRGHYSGDAGALQAGIERNPSAWLFKDRIQSDLYAEICGACGYAELYASEPQELWNAYQAARRDE